jgi:hypothetical protein
MDPNTSPSSTRAIVVLVTNSVNLPIKLIKPSGEAVTGARGHSDGVDARQPDVVCAALDEVIQAFVTLA